MDGGKAGVKSWIELCRSDTTLCFVRSNPTGYVRSEVIIRTFHWHSIQVSIKKSGEEPHSSATHRPLTFGVEAMPDRLALKTMLYHSLQ